MVNNQEGLKMNKNSQNNQNNDSPSLKEIESILNYILPREMVSEIIKVLPMLSSSTVC